MSKATRFLLFGIGGLVGVAILGSVLIIKDSPTQAITTEATNYFKPKPAPDFSLKLLSGKTIRLSDFRGKKGVVLNFWASWCPPCRAEATTLAQTAKEFGDKVVFLGVAINDTPENAQRFIEEFDVTYLNGMDNGTIGTSYEITGIPETFWIDKKGRIINHWIGPIEKEDLVAQTNRIL